jgi:hypothetical protein
MYIKFTKHGKGSPRKAAEYLLNELDAKGEKRPHIETLRGDAQTFVALSESLDFDYRYTSAIIAWSKEDDPTLEQIQETLDAFEKHAFGGLEPTRYHMNAVLHVAKDGSKHVHVLVPRVDLGTGKSLNIAPPGHTGYFDKLRDYLNEKHCWSKPDDLAILKAAASLHDHVHSQRAAAKQIGFDGKTREERKVLINQIIRQRIAAGVIKDKNDVVRTLSEFGVITRNNPKTVSVKLNGQKQADRLEGVFYEDGFNVIAYADSRARAEDNLRASRAHEVDAERLERLDRKMQRACDARTRIFAEKYAIPTQVHRPRDSAALPDLTGQHANKVGISGEADPSISRINKTGAGYSYPSPQSEYSTTTTAAAVSITPKTEHSFISVLSSLDNNRDNPFVGEVNERIKSVGQSASQLVKGTEQATADLHQRTKEVHRALRTVQFSTNSTDEPSATAQFERTFTDVRNASAKTFAREVAHCIGQFEYRKVSTDQDQSGIPTASGRNTAYSIAINASTFDCINQYNNWQRNQLKRVKQQATEARKFSEQLDRAASNIDLIIRKLSSVVIKPKPSIELTDYFRKIGYLSTAAKNIHEWSKRQHEAFQNRNIEQVAYYIQTKYQELSSLGRQKTLEPYEIELLQRNIRNDERIIAYMKKQGCHLSRESEQRLDRVLSVEKSANESRLNNLFIEDKSISQLFQENPETEDLEGKSNQDYNLPRLL